MLQLVIDGELLVHQVFPSSHQTNQTCQVFTEPLWRASVVAQARKS